MRSNVEVEVIGICPATTGVVIQWAGNIGWGEYVIYGKDGKILGDSECMDAGDDKEFLRLLLNDLADKVEVIG